jgi:hypothetical protein
VAHIGIKDFLQTKSKTLPPPRKKTNPKQAKNKKLRPLTSAAKAVHSAGNIVLFLIFERVIEYIVCAVLY